MGIRQASKSLTSRHNPLSDSRFQLEVLNQHPAPSLEWPAFSSALAKAGIPALTPVTPEILQVNVGKLCNQSCAHCHVDAGPDRTEVMSKEVLDDCLQAIQTCNIPKVDITGGAPELNPNFRWFVQACRAAGAHVIHRCNLTILVSHTRYQDLPAFFAAHNVQVVSSLPHFSKLRTDHQRGDGVFDDSIRALQFLNAVGYGMEDTGLILDLVHNPSGAFLPSDQKVLEMEFKRQLKRKYDIDFNHLYTITNLPVSRFLDFLLESGNYASYMQSLIEAFNPATLPNLMCRNTISVGWDGYLYDCDFNQMLDLHLSTGPIHIRDFNPETLAQRHIVVNQHCYGCTAGSGSSCGGELV